MRRVVPVIFVAFGLLLGCSSGRKAYIPVDSPLRTWTPPEADADTAPAPAPAASAPSAGAKKKH